MHASRPLMIFAAGFGTRMGELTRNRPKPLVPLAGRTLIDRAVDLGRAAGCNPIVANTHYLPDLIEPALRRRGVAVSREAPGILDTGGGLKAALPILGPDPAATLNPDVAWAGGNPLDALYSAGLPSRADALLLLVPSSLALARRGPGDFAQDAEGRLTRGGDYVYTGAQILRTEHIATYPGDAFSLNAVWDGMAADGRLFGLVYSGLWCDVGSPEGLAEAERMLTQAGHDA